MTPSKVWKQYYDHSSILHHTYQQLWLHYVMVKRNIWNKMICLFLLLIFFKLFIAVALFWTIWKALIQGKMFYLNMFYLVKTPVWKFQFKTGLSPSKKNWVDLLNWKPFTNHEKCFYFILKALFAIKIFTFL